MRRLTATLCLTLAVLLFSATEGFALPPCPTDRHASTWTDCFGTLTAPNGAKYVGEFRDGKRHGQGTYTSANGDKYVGEYKVNYRHGQGTFYYLADNQSKGDVYVGEWRNGKFHGQGTYTYADGVKYVGEYKDDKVHGHGTYTYANGQVDEGVWENNEFKLTKKISPAERLAEEELQGTLEEERRERFATLTRGLVAADVVAAIVNDGVKLRALPERGAEAVKQLRRGRQVQVTGVLPNGWLQITEEGEPVGWVYKTAVAPDALATTPPAATRPTAVVAATEEPRPVEEPHQALPQERRIALVIGNGRYSGDTPPLANPPNDARLMTAALKTSGFEVIELIDGDQKEMKRAISNFGERLEAAGEDAVGLFYYAGHGVQVDGLNYLIPIGAEISREPDVDVEAVSAVSVLENMAFARNGLNLVILDSCRNNPYSRKFRGAATRGLARMTAPSGTMLAYATGPGEVALDGTGANSPYTLALTQAMAAPGLPVELMFKRVRQAVMEQTNDQQVPWESSSLTGHFFFTQTEPVTARQ